MRRPSTRLANRRPPAARAPLSLVSAATPAPAAVRQDDGAAAGRHAHVLVADGRPDVTAEVSYHLARAGFQVTTALNGAEAVTTIRLREPELVVLGESLAGVDGAEILRRLREVPNEIGIGVLVLLGPGADAAARGDALALGADDCLPWPGDARELVLRAAAVARRYVRGRPHGDAVVRSGPLAIDAGRAEVTIDGAAVHFTRTEFDMLWALARHAGRLLTREQLAALTWGERGAAARGPRRVDRHVYFIREKLGRLGAWVETVSRKGYRFVPPAPPV
jgi:DNA-binding response OmpR family regulator